MAYYDVLDSVKIVSTGKLLWYEMLVENDQPRNDKSTSNFFVGPQMTKVNIFLKRENITLCHLNESLNL